MTRIAAEIARRALRPDPGRQGGGWGGGGLLVALLAVAFAVLLLLPLVVIQFLTGGMIGRFGAQGEDPWACGDQGASTTAQRDIPPDYMKLYLAASKKYGIPWPVLAGIGKVETNHGRSQLPGVASGENFAGAGGPMQFIADTWNRYGVDGNGDGEKDRYDPEDAIPAAGNYLKASGAPARMERAIFAYNHATWYVDMVLDQAGRYAKAGVKSVLTDSAVCDEDLAGVPEGVVGDLVARALAQRGKPYVWGATGPDAFDCSGLVYDAYRSVGVTLPRTTFGQWPMGPKVPEGKEQPGDLVFFNSGPGTGPDNPGHVGLVVGKNKMIEARCTRCGPVKTTTYENRDPLGFTRPLAHPNVKRQLERRVEAAAD
ncbi:MAG: transglycosylase SLT domain-containing protein [Streptosporangiales bacterium]|nr:transglycosylase SLT domain-containing protein [Streptosporangiales bacterium]